MPNHAGIRRPRPRRRSAGQAPRWQSEDVLDLSEDDSDSSDYSPGEDEAAMGDLEMDIGNYMQLDGDAPFHQPAPLVTRLYVR